MTTIPPQQQPRTPAPSWREAALARSEIITDAWEVTKTYAGRIAEWVLFGCMVMNIIEILVTLPSALSNIVLGTQVVMLDVGGFSLASMGDQAREQGDDHAARKASVTGGFLIGVTILTLVLVTISLLWPAVRTYTSMAEKGLILVRVVMTVIYGHVIHSLRQAETLAVSHQVEAVAATFTQQVEQLADELARMQENWHRRLSSELANVREDMQEHLEQQGNLLTARQTTAHATVRRELETTIANSLIPERLTESLTGSFETLVQECLMASLSEMRRTETPTVSSETHPIRLLTPQKVSYREMRPAGETKSDGSHLARISALLDEDRSRKPADLQRLTGIPKATVYRLAERYHREHPASETETRQETETTGGETETRNVLSPMRRGVSVS